MVQRAQEILTNIERGEFTPTGEPSIAVSEPKMTQYACQLPLFPAKEDCLRTLLKELDPDEFSPKQAHVLLYELVEEAMQRG